MDDGSKDNSLAIAKKYEANDARYRVIDKENEGVAIARNVGIATARGKYILPLDADDLIAPTYAEKAINYLEAHSDTKLVYCLAKYFGCKSEPLILDSYKSEELPYFCSVFCSCVYRRDDFLKTRGYNPNMLYHAEDWDFLLSLLEEKDEVYCIPETLFFYRQHGMSRNTISEETLLLTRCQMILNHPERYTLDVNRTLLWMSPMTSYYKNELDKIMCSCTYRISRVLSFPIRWFFSCIKH